MGRLDAPHINSICARPDLDGSRRGRGWLDRSKDGSRMDSEAGVRATAHLPCWALTLNPAESSLPGRDLHVSSARRQTRRAQGPVRSRGRKTRKGGTKRAPASPVSRQTAQAFPSNPLLAVRPEGSAGEGAGLRKEVVRRRIRRHQRRPQKLVAGLTTEAHDGAVVARRPPDALESRSSLAWTVQAILSYRRLYFVSHSALRPLRLRWPR